MISVEVKQSAPFSSFIKELSNVKNNPMLLAEKIKEQILSKLLQQLNAYIVPFDVLNAYPFLEDKAQLYIDYSQALIVTSAPDGVSIEIDKRILQSKGLPPFLFKLLEYGDELIPALAHVRPVMQAVGHIKL